MAETAMESSSFHVVGTAAYMLGVPAKWLRSEAESGRVPAFRAGRRILMDVDEVRRALAGRSIVSPTSEAVSCG